MIENNVARMRKSRNLNQSQLAEKCSLSKNAISLIELGCEPRISTVYKLCYALQCNVDDLYPMFSYHAANIAWKELHEGFDNNLEMTHLLEEIHRLKEKIDSIKFVSEYVSEYAPELFED